MFYFLLIGELIYLFFLSLRWSETTEAISSKNEKLITKNSFLMLAFVTRAITIRYYYSLILYFPPTGRLVDRKTGRLPAFATCNLSFISTKIVPENKSLPTSDTQKPPTENLPDSSTID